MEDSLLSRKRALSEIGAYAKKMKADAFRSKYAPKAEEPLEELASSSGGAMQTETPMEPAGGDLPADVDVAALLADLKAKPAKG